MTHKFIITQELEVQDVVAEAFLSCAVEGGIQYWADVIKKKWVEGHGPYDPEVQGSSLQYDSVYIIDREDEDEEPGRWLINYFTIAKGMELLLTGETNGQLVGGTTYNNVLKCLVDWDDSDYDASDADIVVQLGLFGEVVYG